MTHLDYLRALIIKCVNSSTDTDLLDLIIKLLLTKGGD